MGTTQTTPLVVISGQAHAGKSTLANGLAEHYRRAFGEPFGGKAQIEPLAAPIKAAGEFIFGGAPVPREWYQAVGAASRKADPEVFVKNLEGRARFAWDRLVVPPWKRPLVIVDDCRYQNEAQWAHGLGAVIVRLECPPDVRYHRGVQCGRISPDSNASWIQFQRDMRHESETDLDGFAWRSVGALVIDTAANGIEATLIAAVDAVEKRLAVAK